MTLGRFAFKFLHETIHPILLPADLALLKRSCLPV